MYFSLSLSRKKINKEIKGVFRCLKSDQALAYELTYVEIETREDIQYDFPV